jgi:hypothetical protein
VCTTFLSISSWTEKNLRSILKYTEIFQLFHPKNHASLVVITVCQNLKYGQSRKSHVQCSFGLLPPRFFANLAYRHNFRLSRFPPLEIPCYSAKLSCRHPPQIFRHKSRKTNLKSPVSTAHNYLLTAVYWSVIMECQNWSSDTVIDLIVEDRNRWSVVWIRIITCIYFSSDYICTFNPE